MHPLDDLRISFELNDSGNDSTPHLRYQNPHHRVKVASRFAPRVHKLTEKLNFLVCRGGNRVGSFVLRSSEPGIPREHKVKVSPTSVALFQYLFQKTRQLTEHDTTSLVDAVVSRRGQPFKVLVFVVHFGNASFTGTAVARMSVASERRSRHRDQNDGPIEVVSENQKSRCGGGQGRVLSRKAWTEMDEVWVIVARMQSGASPPITRCTQSYGPCRRDAIIVKQKSQNEQESTKTRESPFSWSLLEK